MIINWAECLQFLLSEIAFNLGRHFVTMAKFPSVPMPKRLRAGRRDDL